MTIVMVIHFLHKAALYFSTPAGNRRLDNMPAVMNKRKVLSIKEKVKVIQQPENGKKKADVHQEFGLVNSTIQKI
jgi:hypothetical protein